MARSAKCSINVGLRRLRRQREACNNSTSVLVSWRPFCRLENMSVNSVCTAKRPRDEARMSRPGPQRPARSEEKPRKLLTSNCGMTWRGTPSGRAARRRQFRRSPGRRTGDRPTMAVSPRRALRGRRNDRPATGFGRLSRSPRRSRRPRSAPARARVARAGKKGMSVTESATVFSSDALAPRIGHADFLPSPPTIDARSWRPKTISKN